MRLSFVIVNYYSEKYLVQCISSIKEKVLSVDYEIIIVNNDTASLTSFLIRKESLKELNIQIIDNGKNIGFGAACNVGAKKAQGEILCFLNPDTEIVLDNICNLLKEFEDVKLAVIGPRLITENNKTQWWCAGKDVNFWQLLKNNFGIIESKNIWENSKEILTDWVSGAAMFARKDIFEKIGGFDEKFFMYVEDIDFCRRIREAGFNVLYYPEFVVLHKGGKSWKNLIEQKYQFFKSTLYYLIKWL